MLTNTEVARAKAAAKPFKLTDGGGLYLEVTPAGGKHWRYRFRLNGKEAIYTVGEYPDATLEQARHKHREARRLVKEGTNPTQQRKVERLQRQHESANNPETSTPSISCLGTSSSTTLSSSRHATVEGSDVN